MVLQRTQPATVWGFAAPGTLVKTTFLGTDFSSTAGPDAVWRQALPAQPATSAPTTITFTASTGEPALAMANVLFGDVYFCSGQSSASRARRASVFARARMLTLHRPHLRPFSPQTCSSPFPR